MLQRYLAKINSIFDRRTKGSLFTKWRWQKVLEDVKSLDITIFCEPQAALRVSQMMPKKKKKNAETKQKQKI